MEACGQMKRLALTLGLALALLATSSAALAAGSLRGTYKTTIPNGPGIPPGFDTTWKITFTPPLVARVPGKPTRRTPGGYTFYQNGTTMVDSGTYKISGSKITFKDQHTGGISCPSTGTYRFKLTGKRLKFTVISDPANNCFGRRVVLTAQPFTKV
jgi:hypothetical protein